MFGGYRTLFQKGFRLVCSWKARDVEPLVDAVDFPARVFHFAAAYKQNKKKCNSQRLSRTILTNFVVTYKFVSL